MRGGRQSDCDFVRALALSVVSHLQCLVTISRVKTIPPPTVKSQESCVMRSEPQKTLNMNLSDQDSKVKRGSAMYASGIYLRIFYTSEMFG